MCAFHHSGIKTDKLLKHRNFQKFNSKYLLEVVFGEQNELNGGLPQAEDARVLHRSIAEDNARCDQPLGFDSRDYSGWNIFLFDACG